MSNINDVTILQQRIKHLEEEIALYRNMHNEFPVMLRKMWSGHEVVNWIENKHIEYVNDIKAP